MRNFLDLTTGKIANSHGANCVALSNFQTNAAALCESNLERLIWWYGGAVIERPYTPRIVNLPYQPLNTDAHVSATRRASVGVFRAQHTGPVSTEPQALLELDGNFTLTPWVDLFSLRAVIRKILGLPVKEKDIKNWLYTENVAAYELLNDTTNITIPAPLLHTLGRFMHVHDDTLLSQKDAVDRSSVSRFALGRYLEQGQLFGYLAESPKGRRRRRWQIPESSLATWLEFNRLD